MDEVVCDASTIAKWFLDEPSSKKALQLQQTYVEGEISLLAPEVLPFEVMNALRYSNVFSLEELQTVARSLSNFGIKLHQFDGILADNTIEIALTEDLTIYDASYVALAVLRDTICYTADLVLLKKLSEEFKAYVEPLSSFERINSQ